MYSFEIDNYLKSRNYNISFDEYRFISDIEKSPQICRISYNSMDNSYIMYTKDNYIWKFYIKKE